MPFLARGGFDLSNALFDGGGTIGGGDSAAQLGKALLHALNAAEQFSIHKSRDGFSIFVNDDTAISELHLIEQLAQILLKLASADFGDHTAPREDTASMSAGS